MDLLLRFQWHNLLPKEAQERKSHRPWANHQRNRSHWQPHGTCSSPVARLCRWNLYISLIPSQFPQNFLLFFALSGCEEVIIYFSVNRLLMKSFLFTASLAPGLLYWQKPDTSRSLFTRNFWWQMDKRFPIQLQLEDYCKFYSRCPRHKGTLGRIRYLPQGLFQWNSEPRSIHSSF